MCGSLRVTRQEVRNFVLGKKVDSGNSIMRSAASSTNSSKRDESYEARSKKRPINLDSEGRQDEHPSKVAKSTQNTIIEPIQPNPNYFIDNNSESHRYIIYMAVRESDPSFLGGLSKCRNACPDGQVQSCLQFDGTRHITMFDGYLTNEQVRNLTYKYNRFEDGKFNPIKLKIEGWEPWDAGCYLKIKSCGEKMLEAMMKKIDGFPSTIKHALQKNSLAKNGQFKFPCNHLSLYRCRPNMDRSKMKKSFGVIRKALADHEWGFVEGVGIRIKVMGEPYSDCKVLAGI